MDSVKQMFVLGHSLGDGDLLPPRCLCMDTVWEMATYYRPGSGGFIPNYHQYHIRDVRNILFEWT